MEQPLIARISVIDDQGFPHTVPIWFARDGDDVIFFSSRSARKAVFAQVNPNGAVSLGGNPYGSEGYLMKGVFVIEEDPGHRWLREITFRYEPADQAKKDVTDWSSSDLVVMRFKPRKVIKV